MKTKKLNILVISNLYPPYYVGGYELMCQYAVEGLRDRGHTVHVLTSTVGGGPVVQPPIYRELRFLEFRPCPRPSETWGWVQQERSELRRLTGLLEESKPDLVYAWNMASLSPFLLGLVERLGYRVVYSLHDLWLIETWRDNRWLDFWRTPASNPLKNAVKAALRKRMMAGYELPFEPPTAVYAALVSRSLLSEYVGAGISIPRPKLIYPGLPMEQFLAQQPALAEGRTRFLYVGQIAEHKGVHTVVEAVSSLVHSGVRGLHLTIVGCLEQCPTYVTMLKQIVVRGKLDPYVRFLGKIQHKELPEVYRQHDVLVFPSVSRESFPLTPLEAWAGRLAVIGTLTGGSAEILQDGVNGLTFQAGDPDDLAAKMRYMMGNPVLRQRLGEAGRQMVGAKFTVCQMVNETEAFLLAAREDHQE